MIWAMALSVILVVMTVLVHYEFLRAIAGLLPHLRMPPHPRILVVIFGVFLALTIEVWLIAGIMYFVGQDSDLGTLKGEHSGAFVDYLYFTASTYTSVGFGDVFPDGHLRLMAGVTALVGLVMIGWSASFTYLAMEKFWGEHHRKPRV